MKKNLPFLMKTSFYLVFTLLLFTNITFAQLVEIRANPSTAGSNPLGVNTYHVSENIYTEDEIGAGNFLSAATAIDQIALNIYLVGTPTTFNNVTIWMKEVPAATTTFTTGTYSTTGYTQVFTGSVTAGAIGWISIPLTTPFQRSAGNNLQVLIERTDGVAHPGFTYWTANGNSVSATAASCRRYNGTAALSAATSLTTAVFRAQIKLKHTYPNDAMVKQIYTLGKLPVPFATPHTMRANVVNIGSNTLTNIPVTLNVTGANTFTDVKTIASLAPGAAVDVSFATFSATAQGNNTINVSIPSDDFNSNNAKAQTQTVNNNTFSYAIGTVPEGGAGFVATPFTGDFVARYNTSVNTAISQVSVYFVTGGQPFQIGIWDATGAGGTPGSLLYTSATQTSAPGVYVLPVLPAVPISSGDFFVGVRQIGTTNISFAYQWEDPVRTGTFYLTQPTGGTTWTDLAPAFKYRFMVEPKLQIPVDANLSGFVAPSTVCTAGPVTYSAVVSNVGLTTINAGAANVTLKIGGANTYTATVSNTTNITAGTSETVYFNGVNLANAGINADTVFVTLAGDTEPLNDTLKTISNSTVSTPVTVFPAVENVEATLPLFPNFAAINGGQLWVVNTGNYTNASQANALAPHGGSKFYLFDSYGGSSSAGFVSRLSSNCVALPANTGASCNYKLRFYMSHDDISVRSQLDSMYVTVSSNNGVTWTRLLPGFQRYNAAYPTPGWEKLEKDLSAYAGQTILIGFEGVSKYGNAFGLDDISIASIPAQELVLSTATNNGVALTTQCDDQGWTWYSNPAVPQAGLLAINWDPTNAGENALVKSSAIVTIQSDAALFGVEDIPAKKATYTMKRYWNVNPNAKTLTGPVNLRFFYDATEKTAADNAASSFATANAGSLETPTWFKTVGTDFNADGAHVNSDAVLNAIPLTNVNTGNSTINGILYAQFNGITSFSGGGYSTGVGFGSPLPVTLLSFSVKRVGAVNLLAWSTSRELNAAKFIVERSSNGVDFVTIGQVAAIGNSAAISKYSFADNKPASGINYYRLSMQDINNSTKYSAIQSVRNEGSADVFIYPNPARSVINLQITADKADKGEVVITDNSGKTLQTKVLTVAQGNNVLPVNVNRLAVGAYIIKITLSDGVIIRKFNKQ